MSKAFWIAIVLVGCGGKKEDRAAPGPAETPAAARPAPVEPPAARPAAPAAGAAQPRAPEPPQAEAGPPPDGKYERVVVEGVTVPMIHVMEGGTVVLVDTDGVKPRTWEEQYKKKRVIGQGELDLHKTDANRSGKFDDDPIDREGLWVIDARGHITKR